MTSPARTSSRTTTRRPGLGSGAALTPLVLGGTAVGTTEFVTMGLLPEIAAGVQATIPQAGHAVSAYALGVVVGAPLVAFLGARLPRRGMLVALMVLFAAANAATALASGYHALLGARFVTGLPHGAFFAVASLVAQDLARPGAGGRAVGRVMLGIPLANIAGVPIATWLGQHSSWRTAYAVIAVVGLITAVGTLLAVPRIAPDREAHPARELQALRNPLLWVTAAVGAIGFGGSFAMYSYISPILRNQTGVDASSVPIFLLIYGIGGFVGTLIAGRLVDRAMLRTLAGAMVGICVLLFTFAFAGDWAIPAAVILFLLCICFSMFVLSLQLRFMTIAGEARTLGASANHVALNVANALGAWLGGVVLTLGWGWRAPSLVGAGLAVLGLCLLAISLWMERRARGTTTVPVPVVAG